MFSQTFTRTIFAHLLCVALGIVSCVAQAELRVIVQYDDSGHNLLRAVELPETNALPTELSTELLKNALTRVTLKWYDSDGRLMHAGSITDPRLVHAPLTSTTEAPEVVGLNTGAYMVSGPIGSAVLEVQLPANPTLGLDAHTYRIDLLN